MGGLGGDVVAWVELVVRNDRRDEVLCKFSEEVGEVFSVTLFIGRCNVLRNVDEKGFKFW
jgi:hypothetical protein